MTDQERAAMQQALEAMLNFPDDISDEMFESITALKAALAQKHDPVAHSGWVLREVLFDNGEPIGHREPQHSPAALAEPEGGGNLPPPLPGDFDHAVGADRFKVVRGAFWWHVLIGDSPTEHGKFHSRASAEKMAADLLREFRNGAFVQYEATLAEPVQEPVQEPVAWMVYTLDGKSVCVTDNPADFIEWRSLPLYTSPTQRKPLTREQAIALWADKSDGPSNGEIVSYCRAIERAHGIGGEE